VSGHGNPSDASVQTNVASLASIKRQARAAGVWYFLVLLIAPIGLVYVPNQLYVRGDATATADHISASETLLRIGISIELLTEVLWVFVVLALYRLFKPVDDNRAREMLILGAFLSVPIVFVSVLSEIAALLLANGGEFLAGFNRSQLDALAMLFYRLHGQGLNLASIFWGLWLFPFGMLVIRSGFMPRFLGWLLFLAGAGYVTSSFTTLLLPQYESGVDRVAGILEFGELPIIFWLLIWGARTRV
jgi:hypothetical protein